MTPALNDYAGWADFWRYNIGVNVIPANGRTKKTFIEWGQWQHSPISKEQHDKWKVDDAFSGGMAVILGEVWHRKDREKYYLTGIDGDNSLAIKEICNSDNVSTFATKTLVEQYDDSLDRFHFYVYSPRPITNKSSDISNPAFTDKLNNNEAPKIEVKCQARIMYCSPSPNANGKPRRVIGTQEPLTIATLEETDTLERHLDDACTKYGLKYLEYVGNGKSSLTPIEELFKPRFQIKAGANRHEGYLRVMDSLLARNRGILALDKIKQLARECTAALGDPPLDDKDFERLWKDAIKFIATNTVTAAAADADGNGGRTEPATTKGSSIETPLLAELEEKIPDKDYAEYAVKVSKKIVRQEDALIRQIQDTGLSAGTSDPLNLGIMAPTSEGKTYPVIEVMKLFPKEQVWKVGHMSPMALVRQKGILVDENNEPVGDTVKKLRREIFLLGNGKKDKIRMVALKEELSEVLETSKRLL